MARKKRWYLRAADKEQIAELRRRAERAERDLEQIRNALKTIVRIASNN
tara:strand:- start:594 stop:740 length:147 start_codon:yes stop_codon:yes gene_type:complete